MSLITLLELAKAVSELPNVYDYAGNEIAVNNPQIKTWPRQTTPDRAEQIRFFKVEIKEELSGSMQRWALCDGQNIFI